MTKVQNVNCKSQVEFQRLIERRIMGIATAISGYQTVRIVENLNQDWGIILKGKKWVLIACPSPRRIVCPIIINKTKNSMVESAPKLVPQGPMITNCLAGVL